MSKLLLFFVQSSISLKSPTFSFILHHASNVECILPYFLFPCFFSSPLSFSPAPWSLSYPFLVASSLISDCFVFFRLSSLTLGDSERRSSPGQQRETLSDLSSDNAGNDLKLICKWQQINEVILLNSSVCFIGTGLVQRCVVVQRDNLGFGFTVCGERIKLVQNVRPGNKHTKVYCFFKKN